MISPTEEPLLRLIILANPVVPFLFAVGVSGASCHWSSKCSTPSKPKKVSDMAMRLPVPLLRL